MVELFFALLIFIGIPCLFLYLQYRLCIAKNGRRLGLILPILSLLCAFLLVLPFVLKRSTYSVGTYDENGNEVVTTVVETDSDWVIDFLPPFLLCNIPTAAYLIEYGLLTGKKRKGKGKSTRKNKYKELKKTQIEDL